MIQTLRRWILNRWVALAAIFSLVILLDYATFELAEAIDHGPGDLLIKLEARRRPMSDRVVIVDIDQRSLADMHDMAGRWPWPRSIHGELIDHVERQNPRAIGLDIMFNEPDIDR